MGHTPQNTDNSASSREDSYNDFVALLTRSDQAIRRFVRSIMPSSDGVDDVVQDTALECWRKFEDFLPQYPEQTNEEFTRWACVIARFKALSWQRNRQRDRLVFRESVVECLAESALERTARQIEERVAVEACLDDLTGENRRLLLSVHAPGDSIARIAQQTGQKARRLYTELNLLRNSLLNCIQQRLSGDTGNA